jgi:hypothetical protein
MAPTAVLERDPAVVRLLPVPRCEPPSDDEWPDEGWDRPAMGAPALPLRLPPGPGRRRTLREPVEVFDRPPRLASRGRPGEGEPDELHSGQKVGPAAGDPAGPEASPAPAPSLPDEAVVGAVTAEVRSATMRFVATFLEVSAGFRPVAHLRGQCRPDRYQRISDHLRGRPATRSSPAVRGAAAFAGRALVVGRMMSTGPARTSRPAADRLSRREASAAMAIRMERTNDRWYCVHLEIV